MSEPPRTGVCRRIDFRQRDLQATKQGAHGGDVVVWTSGSGAYAGLTFNGSVIKADTEENAVPATEPEAETLRHNLSTVF